MLKGLHGYVRERGVTIDERNFGRQPAVEGELIDLASERSMNSRD